MLEKEPYNNRVARNIFKTLVGDKCKPNILTVNSLSDDLPKILNDNNFPEKYDIVVGNPPYQPAQLWEKFILLALKLAEPKTGFINFVVPTSWTSITSDSWAALKEKKIMVINSSDYLKTEYFNKIGSTFSYFLVKNEEKSHGDTIIIYEKNKQFTADLNDLQFLPRILTEDTLSINKKVFINNLDGEFKRKDRHANKADKDDVYKYPYISFIKTDGSVDIKYHDTQDPNQEKKKVLLFRPGYINPYYDNGENGVGDNIHSLIVSNEETGRNMVKLFKSELYKYIWNVNKHSAYNAGTVMNLVFRDVSKLSDFDDKTIYTFFKISDSEKNTIRAILSKKKSESDIEKQETNGGSTRLTRKIRR